MSEPQLLLCPPKIAGLLPAPQSPCSQRAEHARRIAGAIDALVCGAAKWIDGAMSEDELGELEISLHIALMSVRLGYTPAFAGAFMNFGEIVI